jgi:hypothetical protein
VTSAAARAPEARPQVPAPGPAALAGLLGVACAGVTGFLVLADLGSYRWGGDPFPWWGWPLLLVAPVQLWAAVRLLRRGRRWALVLASLPGAAIWVLGVVSAARGGVGTAVVWTTALPVVVGVLAAVPAARATAPVRVPGAVVLAVVLAMLGAAAPVYSALTVVGVLGQGVGAGLTGLPVGLGLLTVAVAALAVLAAARVYRGSPGPVLLACSGLLTGLHTVVTTPGGDRSWRGLLLAVSLAGAAAALLPAVRAWASAGRDRSSRPPSRVRRFLTWLYLE